MVCGEVVLALHGPAVAGVLQLDKDAALLPLGVDEYVKHRAVAVALLVLRGEGACDRIVGRRVPIGGVAGVEAQLQLQYFGVDNIELQVPAQVQGQGREGQYILVGRQLHQGGVVQMHRPEGEVFGEPDGEYALRRTMLPHNAQGVVIHLVGQKGIAYLRFQLPAGDVQRGMHFCGR